MSEAVSGGQSLPEVRFYHLERASVAEELPPLAEKVIATGRPALLLAPDAPALAEIDKQLWLFRPDSFLPHGKVGDGHEDCQPLLMATPDAAAEHIDARDILIIADAAAPDDASSFARVLYMFDSRNDAILAQARADWTRFKDAGHPLSYWQKTNDGWQQKA